MSRCRSIRSSEAHSSNLPRSTGGAADHAGKASSAAAAAPRASSRLLPATALAEAPAATSTV